MAKQSVTIFHNPRCSKSRQALTLLQKKGVEPEIVDYLKEPLDESTLQKMVSHFKGDPKELLRVKDPKFKAAGLKIQDRYTQKDVLDILKKHGELMERAVVLKGKKVVVARPPEKALDVL